MKGFAQEAKVADQELKEEAERCAREAARPDTTPARRRMFQSYFRFYDALAKSEPQAAEKRAQKNAPPRSRAP